MKANYNSIFKKVIDVTKPKKEEIKIIDKELKKFLEKIKFEIKKSKIRAEVFVGGSFAKGTIIKKDHYDIDIFIRFQDYENSKLSFLTEKILSKLKFKFQKIHGSRDYFRFKVNRWLFFEIIPVKKIKNPKEAENITDLSYFHVNYVKNKIKNQNLRDEITLAKVFCYANKCYGAESYISGFSGYGLELLVYYYRGFINFIKAVAKVKNEKVVIDIKKYYRNKNQVLMDLNSAKLQSPIILIDPTYKQRNVLGALSEETFGNFQKVCRNFLKNPSKKYFEFKKTDFRSLLNKAKNKKYDFVFLTAKTEKQEGDIAGSKLLKFYKHLAGQIEKYFEIKIREFEYFSGKTAKFFFAAKKKPKIIMVGPKLKDIKNIKNFKKVHKKTFIKNNRIYAIQKVNFTLKHFINNWKEKNKKTAEDMAIKDVLVIE